MDKSEPPTFGTELRRLRAARGLSLRDLAPLVHHSKTVLWEWETGRRRPSPETAARVDALLDADGTLAAAATPSALADDGDVERLAYVAGAPRTADRGSVEALHQVLSSLRRLEDCIGPGALVAAAAGPVRLVESLADEARGPIRREVVDLAGQWSQFFGWLQAATRRPGTARQWYARSLDYATEAGNEDLIATALSMRGNLAWMARRPGPMLGLSAAAYGRPAGPGVRAIAAQQQARGHALLGAAQDVDRRLDRAAELMAEAAEDPGREPPWIYFYSPSYLMLQRGLAYRLLGRHRAAVAALSAGLAATGAEVRRTEFVAVYACHLAEAHHDLGDHDEACRLLDEVRGVATATQSGRLAGHIDRLARTLPR